MDLLNNSAKYKSYLDRINEYKEIANRNEAFVRIQNRVESLTQELKNSKEKVFYKNVHLGLVVLAAAVGVACFFKGYVIMGIILFLGAAATKYLYTHTLKALIKSTTADQDTQNSTMAFDAKLAQRMQYLKHGIELKNTRISIVRYAFMFLSPIVMIAAVMLLDMNQTVSGFVSSTMAFMMSVIFWFYFFKDDLDELDYQEMELQEYMHDFVVEKIHQKEEFTSSDNGHYISDQVMETSVIDLANEENIPREEKETVQLKLEV